MEMEVRGGVSMVKIPDQFASGSLAVPALFVDESDAFLVALLVALIPFDPEW